MLYTDDQKRDNLRKLAEYLIGLPEDYVGFDMADFFDAKALKNKINFNTSREFDEAIRAQIKEVTDKYARENGGVARCGAVACAVGHGPTVGFLAVDSDFCGTSMDWFRYTRRVFLNTATPDFYWMFGGRWAEHDNTPQGAGKRILYYLEHGTPDEFDEDEITEETLALYQEA